MSRMTLAVGVNEEGEAVLEMREEGIPLAHMIVTGSELSTIIEQLSTLRESLPDPVPDTLDPGSRVQAVANPAWRVPDHSGPEGVLLALRHPGHGWLAFLLESTHAASIADALKNPPPPIAKKT